MLPEQKRNSKRKESQTDPSKLFSGNMYGTKIFRVKHLAFTLCTLSVIALAANLVYKIFFGDVAIRVHDALALEFIGLIEFSTGIHLVLTLIRKNVIV